MKSKDLYKKCFSVSSIAILDSLNKLRLNNFSGCDISHIEKSYYSFPEKQHWDVFRKRKGRFI